MRTAVIVILLNIVVPRISMDMLDSLSYVTEEPKFWPKSSLSAITMYTMTYGYLVELAGTCRRCAAVVGTRPLSLTWS